MSLRLVLHTCWQELRSGLSNGIILFTFIALFAYLIVSLTNAEYLQQLGVTGVSKNGATVIYLMVTGFMFFLFFTWAWIFAQPVLRDRNALLHEVVLAAPINLELLLWGRFLGAVLLGTLLASSILAGFIFSPVLQAFGMLPKGSFGPTPWLQLGYSLCFILLPTTAGIGALYLAVALFTRSLAGPMTTAVLVVLFWMFCVVVLGGGDINTNLAKVLDPSLFTLSKVETDMWTPDQKEIGLLAISNSLIVNRIIWVLFPIVGLFFAIRRVGREDLIAIREARREHTKEPKTVKLVGPKPRLHIKEGSRNWLVAFLFEARWQIAVVFRSPILWAACLLLVVIGMTNAFINVIWHAEGPLLPDQGRVSKTLNQSLYLVIVFMVAGAVGLIARRDNVSGIQHMLDALETPASLRITARALAITLTVFTLSVVPAFSTLFTTLLVDPAYLDVDFAFGYQALVIAPAQLEIAMIVFLGHALIRQPGLAYAVSIFLVAVLIANHELQLVDYPPLEIGMPLRISYSPLTTWDPWLRSGLFSAGFKWALGFFFFGLAALIIPLGLDSRWHQLQTILRKRVIGLPGFMSLSAALLSIGFLSILNTQFIDLGGYRTAAGHRADAAAWEHLWVEGADRLAFQTGGGHLSLIVDTSEQSVHGQWTINDLKSSSASIYGDTPSGLVSLDATVNGRAVLPEIIYDHYDLPLGECAKDGCQVTLKWTTQSEGWSTTGQAAWSTHSGMWVAARDVMPSLGLNPDRVLRSPDHREAFGLPMRYRLPKPKSSAALGGVAPAGLWSWDIELTSESRRFALISPSAGATNGHLNFAIVAASGMVSRSFESLTVHSASSDQDLAEQIAEDALYMRRCVERRLQVQINLTDIVRFPGGNETSQKNGSFLYLSEQPNWQVQNNGVGQLVRRANLAKLMARQVVLDQNDVRQSSGGIWLKDGLPGAIGLLCVGDVDGVDAMGLVMARYADATTKALSASEIPVESLSDALTEGWAQYYSPLATVNWAAGKTPDELSDYLAYLSTQDSLEEGLSHLESPEWARAIIGPPLSSRLNLESDIETPLVTGRRFYWQAGGWRPSDLPVKVNALVRGKNGTQIKKSTEFLDTKTSDITKAMLLIDDWPSYQPSVVVLQPKTPEPALKE